MNLPNKQQIESISRELITELAPHELLLFPAMNEAWQKNPKQLQAKQTAKSGILNFGGTEMVEMLTPVILSVVSTAATMMATHALFDRLKGDQSRSFSSLFQSGRQILSGKKPGYTSRSKLKAVMQEAFNQAELEELCFDLNVDFEELITTTKTEAIISIILHFERHQAIGQLVHWCHNKRPNQFDFDNATSAGTLSPAQIEELAVAAMKQQSADISPEKVNQVVSTVLSSLAMA